MAALDVIRDEKLVERSAALGVLFREEIGKLQTKLSWVAAVRGKGLMNAVVVDPNGPVKAWDLCLKMRDLGLLAKPTHDHIIRFTPPLVITESELREGCQIITQAFLEASKEVK
jgi:ornithine--oxo-acid transaminase